MISFIQRARRLIVHFWFSLHPMVLFLLIGPLLFLLAAAIEPVSAQSETLGQPAAAPEATVAAYTVYLSMVSAASAQPSPTPTSVSTPVSTPAPTPTSPGTVPFTDPAYGAAAVVGEVFHLFETDFDLGADPSAVAHGRFQHV